VPDAESRTAARAWQRPRTRALALAALGLAALAAHLLAPGAVTLPLLAALAGGVAAGLLIARLGQPLALGRDARTTAVVAQDIQTLRQAFEVLRRQVDATIQSSEQAVVSMTGRMNRVHHNAQGLRERILQAVERSHALSSDSLAQAGQHGQDVALLASHQQRFEEARRLNQQRVQAVAERVRALTPLAALIADISRQTNLLAINASIEAARAGPEGAGFKVVATEVRRLSAQTAEAARQIGQGIAQAAATIDTEMADAKAMHGDDATAQLGRIAAHMQQLGDTLGDVLPYLGQLAGEMDSGMATVTEDILNTLGDMQFQDVNRQLQVQINDALSSLSDHFAKIYQLTDGQAPPPPELLEELLARWTDNYVMQSQRMAHDGALAATAGGGAPATAPAAEIGRASCRERVS
jgi:phage host-nuclease inhibitor protein Gam